VACSSGCTAGCTFVSLMGTSLKHQGHTNDTLPLQQHDVKMTVICQIIHVLMYNWLCTFTTSRITES
jgi:hypothetical protein